ncbi:uncharacterized protein MJAP1_003651 [Malassezia japonica]|uniref:Uncharacterized protein n=1 Tax=Malassezia japonica TaxID=223818 RepID=A0AAF0JBM7_9BASI|nr:uncharacterized protein MJAP1_003651 [Malassezia japonica]WFD40663.1 hypothetical protein MJAP1_003651 [Malassezia japonica]
MPGGAETAERFAEYEMETEAHEEGHEHDVGDSSDEAPPTMRFTFHDQDFAVFPARGDSGTIYYVSNDPDEELESVAAPELVVAEDAYWNPLESIFSALRIPSALGEFLDEDTALTLAFPDLDLSVQEDDMYTREISLHDIYRLALGFGFHASLHVVVTQTPRFISRYNELATMMNDADDAIWEEHDGEEIQEISEEDAEQDGDNDQEVDDAEKGNAQPADEASKTEHDDGASATVAAPAAGDGEKPNAGENAAHEDLEEAHETGDGAETKAANATGEDAQEGEEAYEEEADAEAHEGQDTEADAEEGEAEEPNADAEEADAEEADADEADEADEAEADEADEADEAEADEAKPANAPEGDHAEAGESGDEATVNEAEASKASTDEPATTGTTEQSAPAEKPATDSAEQGATPTGAAPEPSATSDTLPSEMASPSGHTAADLDPEADYEPSEPLTGEEVDVDAPGAYDAYEDEHAEYEEPESAPVRAKRPGADADTAKDEAKRPKVES